MRDDPGTQVQGSLVQDSPMRESLTRDSLMAQTLGVAMARRATDILRRRQETAGGTGSPAGPATGLAGTEPGGTGPGGTEPDVPGPGENPGADPARFAADDAVFSAVLDAANECLGRFDSRPSGDRWCDALMQLITLADCGPGD